MIMRSHTLEGYEDETRLSRLAGVAIVIGVHLAVAAVLMHVDVVRDTVAESMPVFVSFLQPQPVPPVVTPAPPPPAKPPPPKRTRQVAQRPAEAPSLTAAPAPAVNAEAPVLPEPLHEPAPPAPAEPAPATADVVTKAAPPDPRVVTAVAFVRRPQVEYPPLSRRLGEHGRVVLRVLVNREGRAERVEVQATSGSPRLDEAAIRATREAIYRPHLENGEAVAMWAIVPTLFELN